MPDLIVGYYEGINPSACALVDGAVAAYIEEERLVRIKHAPWRFPTRAIAACLKTVGAEVEDVSAFAYPWDAPAYADGRVAAFYRQLNQAHPPDAATKRWQAANLTRNSPGAVAARLTFELRRATSVSNAWEPVVAFVPHHESHAFVAVAGSPSAQNLVVSLDGSGETTCSEVWSGTTSSLNRLWSRPIPHSLGWFYAAVTELLGYDAYDGEHKVMGLAALGHRDAELADRLRRVLILDDGPLAYRLEPRFIHAGSHSFSHRFTDEFVTHIGSSPRAKTQPLEQRHADIALAAQHLLEEAVCGIVAAVRADPAQRTICLTGGVALNVKMAGRVAMAPHVDDVWVPPYPNDSGAAVGAAIRAQARNGGTLAHAPGVYLGPEYATPVIRRAAETAGWDVTKPSCVASAAAARIARGDIVGWFSGRSEAGQRALGARSLLAHPRLPEVGERINRTVKRREPWRPLCPSILEEDASRYLAGRASPYMMIALTATEAALEEIPVAVHHDGTVRAQIVDRNAPPRFRQLLAEFKRLTGIGAVINTSLNRDGQPIVETPREALELFGGSAIDSLVLDGYVIDKRGRHTAVD